MAEQATEQMFYLLACRECGDGKLVMPFASAEARGKWAVAHTQGTGHERWFVTDQLRQWKLREPPVES